MSGGPSAYFRVSLSKYKLLGIVEEVIDFFYKFWDLAPNSWLKAQKVLPKSYCTK